MDTLNDLLASKGRGVISVAPDATIAEAIRTLVEHRIGSLLVAKEGGGFSGILTERDVLNFVHAHPGRIDEARVEEHMTREVVTGEPEDDLDSVMNLMTERRFRHLPVVSDGEVVGMISIGDVVKSLNTACRRENRQLKQYIDGSYR